jgi:replicative DNA helicase
MLSEVGGTPYLVSLLAANIGGIVGAGEYAKVIRDTWLRRQLIDVAEQIVAEAYGLDPAADASRWWTNQAAESVLALGEASADSRGTDLATAAEGAIRRSEAAIKSKSGEARLDTGLPSLNSLIGGLWPGQLYYLMARSSTGKTPAMMQIARNVAASLLAEAQATKQPPGHVHVFSLRPSVVREIVKLVGCSVRTAQVNTVAHRKAMIEKRDRLIWGMHREGRSQEAIGAELEVPQRTVADVISRVSGKRYAAQTAKTQRHAPPKLEWPDLWGRGDPSA